MVAAPSCPFGQLLIQFVPSWFERFFTPPLRAFEGFLVSLMGMLKLCLPVPSYSQISRRSTAMDRIL
jgi:hypothetical protein